MNYRLLVVIGLAVAGVSCSRKEPPAEKIATADRGAGDAAVALVQRLGGSVEFDESAPGRPDGIVGGSSNNP